MSGAVRISLSPLPSLSNNTSHTKGAAAERKQPPVAAASFPAAVVVQCAAPHSPTTKNVFLKIGTTSLTRSATGGGACNVDDDDDALEKVVAWSGNNEKKIKLVDFFGVDHFNRSWRE